MPESMFSSIIADTLDAKSFLICSLTSIILGILIALVHMFRSNYSKNLVITLALLPFVVQCVIMMVNGNVGAGVAVAGAFSLVRFRSAQGNAREIASVFLVMAIGLATGMGYIFVALSLAAVSSVIMLLCAFTGFGSGKSNERILRVTVPDGVDFTSAFREIFDKYTRRTDTLKYKTSNLGSLFIITYKISLKSGVNEKELVDELRCKNGNLDIVCMLHAEESEVL